MLYRMRRLEPACHRRQIPGQTLNALREADAFAPLPSRPAVGDNYHRSSLASKNRASSTALLKSATVAPSSSNSAARCHRAFRSRSFDSASMYVRASRTVRRVPPSLVTSGRVSLVWRYAEGHRFAANIFANELGSIAQDGLLRRQGDGRVSGPKTLTE